ncbi:MAG: 2-oxoacid:ferredoxin oxidoreductase subunit beta [Calditrichaeota bacterium]|nr:2-oxoacid:ferredoxin oxidoreductase subunit beta [Calditrichota bacterium]RQV92165.1 MAG: 2-oxoacid:ferredoxin oxidoreductase subunit beta [bacterium]
MTQPLVLNYLRAKKQFPHVWCPGCGHGVVMGSLIRSIDKLELNKDNVVMVSGIGCSSRMTAYVDFNTLHTLHGRPIAFATGLKLAKPELPVIVITGDGDATAIGGNHFIHAARRNIDLTVILMNNNIYGMTGGQISPTTPYGGRGSTAKIGNPEHPFDICKLAIAAGASFVARSTAYHVPALDRLIQQALENKGFSLVEIFSQCPTYEGKWNKRGDAAAMLKYYKETAVPVASKSRYSEEELKEKFLIGVLHNEPKPEFTSEYEKIIEKYQSQLEMKNMSREKVEDESETKKQNDKTTATED